MSEYALIEDGCSVETTIPRLPGIYPAVKIRFRPAMYSERARLSAATQRDFDGTSRAKVVTEIVAAHLESWDVKTKADQPVNCRDEKQVAKLNPALLDRMLDMILAFAAAPEDSGPNSASPSGS